MCTPRQLFLFFCAFWLSGAALQAQCTGYTAPFYENFDGSLSTPTCWTNTSATGSAEWEFQTSGGFGPGYGVSGSVDHTSGTGNFAWIDFSGSDPADMTLESPLIDVSALTTPYLSFWILSNNTNSPGNNNTITLDVYDGATWHTGVVTYAADNANWVEVTYNFSSLTITGTQVKFRIVANSTAGSADYHNDLLIDDVRLTELPSCLTPNNVTVSNVTTTNATINWTSSATSWDIEYGPAGFALGTGTMLTGITTNPHTLTGLNSSTDYDVYIRGNCTASSNGVSLWAKAPSLSTLCAPIVAPFTQNFDGKTALPSCWDNYSGTTGTSAPDWEFQTSGGGGPAYGVAGAVDHTSGSGNYAWVDFSSSKPEMALETPEIDISGVTSPIVSFWILSNNTNSPGDNNTLRVDVYNGTTWVQGVGSYSADNPNWVQVFVGLNTVSFSSNIIRVRFVANSTTASNTFHNDLLIDDIYVGDPPPCPAPTNLDVTAITTTSATLSWTPGSAAPDATLEYGPTGFTPGSGTSISNISTPYNLTGLSANTYYDFYITENCSYGGQSYTSAVRTFNTACAAFSGNTFPDPFIIPTNMMHYSDTNRTDQCFTDFIGNASPDAVYRIVPDVCTESLDITLCGSLFDTNLRIYDTDQNPISYNNDFCGSQSNVSNLYVANYDTLYIVIEGNETAHKGTYYLDVTQNSLDNIAFTYPKNSLCASDGLTLPNVLTNAQGSARFTTNSANLAIDSLSGLIDPATSLAGTYQVYLSYTTPKGCIQHDTLHNLEITTPITGSLTYSSNAFCPGAGVITPTTASPTTGVFSSNPNLALDASTGAIDIDNSVAGNYIVEYEVTSMSGCVSTITQSITIDTTDIATVQYSSPSYCANGLFNPIPTVSGNTNGVFTAPSGLDIDAATGQLFLRNSTAGNYSVTYTSNGNCPSVVTLPIDITPADDANFEFANDTLCNSAGTHTPTITGLSGGVFGASGALNINSTTGEIASASPTGRYIVTYSTSGVCPASHAQTIYIEPNTSADFSFAKDTLCGNYGAIRPTITGNTGGRFTASNGLNIHPFTGEIPRQTVAGNYTITYTTPGVCGDTKQVDLVLTTCTGTQHLQLQAGGFSVFPNPSQGQFFLENQAQARSAQIRVTNLLGQILLEEVRQLPAGTSYTIDLPNAAAGTYLLQVIEEDKVYSTQLIVRH